MNKNCIFTSLSILGLSLTFCASALAEDINGGREIMPVSRISCSPVFSAMGYSGTASVDEVAWSAFGNSAVIPMSTKTMDVKASYQNWAPAGMNSSGCAIGGTYKLKNIGFSLGGYFRAGKQYEFDTVSGNDSWYPLDFNISAGIGYAILPMLSVGLNLRYMKSLPFPSMSLNTFGGDFIVMGKFMDFRIATGVKNIGLPVKSESGEKFYLPSSAVLAGDYTKSIGYYSEIKATADFDYVFSNHIMASLGVQYGWRRMLYARCGYHFGDKGAVLPSFASLGGGIDFFGISLDLSYMFANKYLANTLAISLGYSF